MINLISSKARYFILGALLTCTSKLVIAATITVNSGADASIPSNDGNCTLREAIKAANDDVAIDACSAGNGADVIVFASSVTEVTVSVDDLSDSSNKIVESLSIQGRGVDSVVINGDSNRALFYFDSPGNNQTFNISGLTLFNAGRAVYIQDGETVNVDNVVFDSNSAGNGAAIYVDPSSNDQTTLAVNQSTFKNNTATSSSQGGGAVFIRINADATFTESSFWNNTSAASGGALWFNCQFGANTGGCDLKIFRSTFSGNTAVGRAGGLGLAGTANSVLTARIAETTITKNTSNSAQNASVNGEGGGISLDQNVALSINNSVVAENIDDSANGSSNEHDIGTKGTYPPSGASIVTFGTNFIGNNTSLTSVFPTGAPNMNDDYAGTAAASLDPALNDLADNGGPTLSHLPLVGSALIDAGECEKAFVDQRGFSNQETQERIVDDPSVVNGVNSDGCDIGSIEVGAQSLIQSEESCFITKAKNGAVTTFCL